MKGYNTCMDRQDVTSDIVRDLYRIPKDSHKGQNGRVLLIGGSKLFHAASLWSLTIASRIVDLVHYASIDENNAIVHEAKREFRNGIVIARSDIEAYIVEDNVILIGPGMVRVEAQSKSFIVDPTSKLQNILSIDDEGMQTYVLTNYLLRKYPNKQWVIDAGALQMVEVDAIPKGAILTPHRGEFAHLWHKCFAQPMIDDEKEAVVRVAQRLQCIVLKKGVVDVACDGRVVRGDNDQSVATISGGNEGMSKGGTGDVLAGLIAALAAQKNDAYLATLAGSYISKAAGDRLYSRVGPYFNATDLANEIPAVMGEKLYRI